METLGFIQKVAFPLTWESESLINFYFFMQIFMFLVTLISTLFVSWFFYITYRYPQFHVNFGILNANLFISYFVLTIAREIVFIGTFNCSTSDKCYITQLYILKDYYYCELLKHTAMIAFLVSASWIIFERIWATIYLKSYEKKRSYIIIIIIVIFQWIASFGSVWLFFNGYLPFLIASVSGVLLFIILAVVYYRMNAINYRRHKYLKYAPNSYSLSERFQVAENVRTSPLILAFIRVGLILNTLQFASAAVIFYCSSSFYNHFAKLIWDFALTIYPYPVIISAILGVQKWKDIVYRPIAEKRRQTSVGPIIRQKILTIDGENVLFDVYMERTIYFQQLAKSWS